MQLPTKLPFDLMITKWASILNPLLGNLLTQGILLPNITLVIGNNVINHRLGRKQLGWYIVDVNAASSIYRSADLNDLTLTLNSSADCIVSIWAF